RRLKMTGILDAATFLRFHHLSFSRFWDESEPVARCTDSDQSSMPAARFDRNEGYAYFGNRALGRNFALVLRTILDQKLADFSSQNLVSSRTEMNLVGDEQGWNRFLVRAQHVRKNVDIVCLWPRVQIILHEAVELSNVGQ